jgi:acetyl esterase/lipase
VGEGKMTLASGSQTGVLYRIFRPATTACVVRTFRQHFAMKLPSTIVFALLLGIESICNTASAESLLDVRQGFTTTLTKKDVDGAPVPDPPKNVLQSVKYNSPIGDLAAYITPSPRDGKLHPAMIWIFGGFSNSINETAWASATPDNDQSARAFRDAGIIMMYPSLRGGNRNPGYHESFYGEVNDILSALDYLAKQEYVDPKRIYLGGHSTGGTLALLVAESTDQFRSIFSFGPVSDVRGYGADALVFDISKGKEFELRAPVKWLHAVSKPTFVFEGTDKPSNIASFNILLKASTNPLIHFYSIQGKNHFSTLAPITKVIAAKILLDGGPSSNIQFTQKELEGGS